MIEVPTLMWLRLCMHYIDDLLPYEPLCSYWACDQVFITSRVPIHKSIWPTDEVIMMNNDETYDEIMMKLG